MNELSLVSGQDGLWTAFMRGLAKERRGSWQGMREVGRQNYVHRFDVRGGRIGYVALVFRKEMVSGGAEGES